jgi:DNA (cytosine-5)-methyltransferase 1
MVNFMTHGSLFSGRGTWDIVAQELGFKNKFNCELDPWLRTKLLKISPHAKQYTNAETCMPDCTVTVLSASFPCQNISSANQTDTTGIHGIKSSLWREVKRVATITQPRYIVVENSSILTKRGLEVILSDLSEIGYDAEWHCLQGRDFGFPQRRERIFIIAYPNCDRRELLVYRPPEAFELSRKWAPTEAYLRVLACRADRCRNTQTLQRGNVVHNFGREIHAFGNAVMPVIVEYLLKCIIEDYKLQKN